MNKGLSEREKERVQRLGFTMFRNIMEDYLLKESKKFSTSYLGFSIRVLQLHMKKIVGQILYNCTKKEWIILRVSYNFSLGLASLDHVIIDNFTWSKIVSNI